ncbi:hypothetical protein [Saccharothrix xinjiangensis]|uniref:DksA C4-type domain-containing protein n=1 Tax=Saccharothrix xinjiangensis TaxID=204798 RepID=A0ABV9XW48_9PSEU
MNATTAQPRRRPSTTAQPEERCQRSDLYLSACAHCRGLELDPALRNLAEVHIARWVVARGAGRCGGCGHDYAKGDRLAVVGPEERVCERCAS